MSPKKITVLDEGHILAWLKLGYSIRQVLALCTRFGIKASCGTIHNVKVSHKLGNMRTLSMSAAEPDGENPTTKRKKRQLTSRNSFPLTKRSKLACKTHKSGNGGGVGDEELDEEILKFPIASSDADDDDSDDIPVESDTNDLYGFPAAVRKSSTTNGKVKSSFFGSPQKLITRLSAPPAASAAPSSSTQQIPHHKLSPQRDVVRVVHPKVEDLTS